MLKLVADVNLADPAFESTAEQLGERFKPACRTAAQPAAASPLARHPLGGSAIASRFGEISPSFAAAFGASVTRPSR